MFVRLISQRKNFSRVSVVSACSLIRKAKVFLSLCQNYADTILGDTVPKNPRPVPAFQEVSELRIDDIMDSALHLSVTLAVRYAVEWLHAIGAVSLTHLSNIHFSKRLASLSKVKALRVVVRMWSAELSQKSYEIS